jgi:uncharacterized cupin superfamily protein
MGWEVAHLDEVSSTAEPGFWQEWAREPDFGENWLSIGDHFGIAGFGINANRADAGRELIVPHTETAYGGQEELYLVISGEARFVCDGQSVKLGPGGMLHIGPDVTREATALEDGTLVVCIGGTPGQPYAPG